MKFGKRSGLVLLLLAIILNIVIRFPSLPHSYGIDTYVIRNLANSIALFGEARYWLNPWSIGGFYPFSYASAEPFMLAGVKELAGLSNEAYPLVFDIILGLFSFFAAFLLAREVVKSGFYTFVVALVFSLAPGVLIHTTWSVSTRGLFIVLLPVFLYLFLSSERHPWRASFLGLIMLGTLAVTHHFFWFTLPMVFGFIGLRILKSINSKGFFTGLIDKTGNRALLLNTSMLGLFIAALGLPFISYFFIKGSKYAWITRLITINLRYSGPLFLFAIAGFAFLLFKEDKDFNEWYILLTLLGISPAVYNATYTHFIMIIFVSLLVGYAFTNLTSVSSGLVKRRFFLGVLVIAIVLSAGFSTFYQHNRTHSYRVSYDWYMLESTYEGGLWINNYIPYDRVFVGLNPLARLKASRMNVVAGGFPRFVSGEAAGIVYEFIDPKLIKVRKNKLPSTSFFQDNPYIKTEPKWSVLGLLNWMSANDNDIDNSLIIKQFDVTHLIEDPERTDALTTSLHEKKDAIFSNGEVKIWTLSLSE